MTYYKLLDKDHYGQIIKADGRKQYEYDLSTNQWVRSGIMLHYFSDESETYDMYEEISEKDALEQIEINKKMSS